jgi:cathepsin E
MNGTVDGIYLVASNFSTPPGLDFIFGQTFLERFYSVFDTGRRRVGLATTNYTFATTN